MDLRHVREEEAVVDVPLREIVGSLMWIANQTRPDIANAVRAVARFSHDPKPIHYKAARKTRPDIANAVRAVARFSHDPKPIHYKAARKILEYQNATSNKSRVRASH